MLTRPASSSGTSSSHTAKRVADVRSISAGSDSPVACCAVACPSGLRSTPRKRVRVYALRGFKSHRHRHSPAETPARPRGSQLATPCGGAGTIAGTAMFLVYRRGESDPDESMTIAGSNRTTELRRRGSARSPAGAICVGGAGVSVAVDRAASDRGVAPLGRPPGFCDRLASAAPACRRA